ncbi:MAG: class I SAM-dependent methyltransferase [Rhodothermales bacterium]|nr:class I SAM-dependent methyltransferase [Rhodothermales bacterium]
MPCNQCIGVEEEFDATVAKRQLKRYVRRGPKRTTEWLIRAILDRKLAEPSLLDIGGGVGEIQHEIAESGSGAVTSVDASSAYLDQSRLEAERRGYRDRATYVFASFTDVHEDVSAADVVTLDRVICCFDNVEDLVGRSVQKAKRLYGLVYPRESWWTALGFILINLVQRIRRAHFRVYLHSSERVHSMIADAGFRQAFYRQSFLWQVVLYEATGD